MAPSCCFNARTAAVMSAPRVWLLCQSRVVGVWVATCLGTLLNRLAMEKSSELPFTFGQ
ncbi:hypothetical protein D3C85_1526620 [compost metagenome]